MTSRKIRVSTFIVVFLTSISISGIPAADSAEDILVFVNKSVSVDSITLAELKQIFLKKRNNWSDGKRIICINVQGNEKIRQIFRQKVLDMNVEEEQTYWEKQKVQNQLLDL